MRERLERRLEELTTEFQTGQQMLMELEARQAALRDTLLRLDGAITVLREELHSTDQTPESVSSPSNGTAAPSAEPRSRVG